MTTVKKHNNKNSSFSENNSRFETFDGYCYVLDDRIVQIKGHDVGPEKAFLILNLQRLKIFIFATSSLLSMTYSAIEFINTNLLFSVLYLLFAILFGVLVKWQMTRSKIFIVTNSAIENARFYGARFGRKRSFFEIAYSKNFIVRYTKIFLSPSEDSDSHNTTRALSLMEHLLDSDDFFTKI